MSTGLRKSVVLSIAGFDPSGGAGILADCRTIEAFGMSSAGIITALTIQNVTRVRAVTEVQPKQIVDTAAQLAATENVAAVKIGMLHNAKTVDAVAQALEYFQGVHMVLDPVIRASDDTPLLDQPGMKRMIEILFPLVTVVTPNVLEAQTITGLHINDAQTANDAALRILGLGAKNVVIKGGHLPGDPIDLLVTQSEKVAIKGNRLEGKTLHGSGCVFSSAMAAALGKGETLISAVKQAKEFVTLLIAGLGNERG